MNNEFDYPKNNLLRSAVIFFGLAFIVSVVLFLENGQVSIIPENEATDLLLYVALLGLLISWGFTIYGIIGYLRNKNKDPLDYIYPFSFIFGLFYCIRALSFIFIPEKMRVYLNWPQDYGIYLLIALGLAVAGLISFYIGYMNQSTRRVSNTLPLLPTKHLFGVSLKRVILIYSIGLLGYFFILMNDQILVFMGTRSGTSVKALTSYSLLLRQARIAGIFFAWSLNPKQKSHFWIIPVLMIIMETFLGFLAGSKRFAFDALVISIFAFHYVRKQPWIKPALMGGALFALVVFPVVQSYRKIVKVTSDVIAAGNLSGLVSYLNMALTNVNSMGITGWLNNTFYDILNRARDLDPFAMIVYRIPDQIPFFRGETFKPLIYGWIPRIVWTNKPTISFGRFMNEVIIQSFTNANIPLTTYGELYLNFGPWAVPFGMFLFGYFVSVTVKYFKRYGIDTPVGFVFYAIFFIEMIMPATYSLVILSSIRNFIFIYLILFIVSILNKDEIKRSRFSEVNN